MPTLSQDPDLLTTVMAFEQAWKRHIETRNKILETLAGVPDLLASVHGKWKTHRDDQDLCHIVEDFEAVLLDSLTSLARLIITPQRTTASACMRFPFPFLGSHCLIKEDTGIKRVVRKLSEKETREMDSISKRITSASNRVSDHANLLQDHRLMNVEKTGVNILREVQATRSVVHEIPAVLRDLTVRMSQLEQQRQDTLVPTVRGDNIFFMVSSPMVSIMQTGLYDIVSEDRYIECKCSPQNPSFDLVYLHKDRLPSLAG